MKIDASDMLNSILESLSRIDYIHADEIPNIDLYMDQVTTFMDSQLSLPSASATSISLWLTPSTPHATDSFRYL